MSPNKTYVMKNNMFIGRRFGKLIVIGPAPPRPNHKTSYWLCECDCGNTKEVAKSNLKTNGKRGGVKSCGCLLSFPTGSNSEYWVGVGKLPNTIFLKIKGQAKRRKICFELTIEYLWDLFVKQNQYCNLSGLLLSFPASCRDRYNGNYTASLDRIDSTKGYVVGNVQWLHKDINMMKQALTQNKFIEYCNLIVRRMSCDCL